MIRLEVLDGQDTGTVVESQADVVRIGRSEACELSVSEFHVSGEHVQIVFAGDVYVVRDNHSTNGTRVRRGDEHIALSDDIGRETELQSGDVLELGDLERPLRVGVSFDEEDDTARIVSVRHVAELDQVEAAVGADRELLKSLYDAQKAITDRQAFPDVD